MPDINKKVDCTCGNCDHEFTEEVDVSFDVYCGECGTGICSSSDYDKRKDKLTVRCPHCFKAFEDVIKGNDKEIERLTEIEYYLRQEVETLKEEIKKYQCR